MKGINSTLNEQEVLNYLIQRKNKVLLELDGLEKTINAMAGSDVIEANPSVPVNRENKKVKVIGQYNSKLTIDEKILYAINKLSNPDRNEIIECLMQENPSADEVKLKQNVTTRLSILRKNNKINSVKEGPRFNYSLLEY